MSFQEPPTTREVRSLVEALDETPARRRRALALRMKAASGARRLREAGREEEATKLEDACLESAARAYE